MKRTEAATVQYTLRFHEPLRARLEEEAARHGYSLNFEMVQRLVSSLQYDDVGRVVFRDESTFELMKSLARIIRTVERDTGKTWHEDRETCDRVVVAICSFLTHILPAMMPGQSLPDAIQDAGAYRAIRGGQHASEENTSEDGGKAAAIIKRVTEFAKKATSDGGTVVTEARPQRRGRPRRQTP